VKEIPLKDRGMILVDDEDYPWVSRFVWQPQPGSTTYYAVRLYHVGRGATRRGVPLLLHRLLLPCEPGCEIDHIDGNGLNNQKKNLRLVSTSQNQMNRSAGLRNNSSRYKGVSFNRKNGTWHAYIKAAGKRRHLGYFADEREAAFAYNKAAVELFGEYARPNVIEG
jgi:hypothetical protein